MSKGMIDVGPLKSLCRSSLLLSLSLLGITGCGNLMVCCSGPQSCDSSLVDCVDAGQCTSCGDCTQADLSNLKARLEMHRAAVSEKLAVCKARLEVHCPSSKLAQWKAEQREKLTAPPFPRFHPVPTHPVFFPEDATKD